MPSVPHDLDHPEHPQQRERREQVAVAGNIDVRSDVPSGYPVPEVEIVEVVRDPLRDDRPERHAAVDERRRVVTSRQTMRMAERVDDQRHEEHLVPEPDPDEPPEPATRHEDGERDGEQRGDQTAGRIAIREERERQRDVTAAHGERPRGTEREVNCQQDPHHPQRKERRVVRNTPQSVEPRAETCQDDCAQRDARPSYAVCEHREDAECGHDVGGSQQPRHTRLRSGNSKDHCQHVDEDRALVVPERLEVEGAEKRRTDPASDGRSTRR